MIKHVSGNLLDADAEAYVNTVNTVGVMGKGIALQMKRAFPQVFAEYKKAAAAGEVRPGRMHVVETGRLHGPRFVINFPTKRHWKGKSRIEDIESGLEDLVAVIRDMKIRSVAIPPLGCGNGGLRWSDVRPRIERALRVVPEVTVLLYAPEGAPDPEHMKVATRRPNMSPGLAALIGLFEKYSVLGFQLTLLEVQKLAYFLQVLGEPAMRLKFEKGQYGPYSDTLNKMLERMEGHYIRGYGDNTQGRYAELVTLPDAKEVAESVLTAETRNRIARVADLIMGFETPYGMELLATVHWLTLCEPGISDDPTRIAERVHRWNEHKKAAFSADHVQAAWQQLRDRGWLVTVA